MHSKQKLREHYPGYQNHGFFFYFTQKVILEITEIDLQHFYGIADSFRQQKKWNEMTDRMEMLNWKMNETNLFGSAIDMVTNYDSQFMTHKL